MKQEIKHFIIDFISMFIIISIIEFIFYKLKLMSSFNIYFIVGFMIGWSIWQLTKLLIFSKNKKRK